MQFEKLNDNKIRITLNIKDFEDRHIDFHSFMANPIESQNLFLDMLSEAEKQIGFVTKNYQIRIEALAVSNGDFIITVTRLNSESLLKSNIKKNLKVKRKSNNIVESKCVYSFYTYDDFYYFMRFLKNQNINIKNIAKTINFYEYNNIYYLTFSNITQDAFLTKKFNSLISEFGCYVNNSSLFINKLTESGKLIIKNSNIQKYIDVIPVENDFT